MDDGLGKWVRSSRCESSACIEFTVLDTVTIALRDSKNAASGPVLQFTRDGWGAFLYAIGNDSLTRRSA